MLLGKAEADWKGQLRALRHAEYLVRAAPDELEQYAGGALCGRGVVDVVNEVAACAPPKSLTHSRSLLPSCWSPTPTLQCPWPAR